MSTAVSASVSSGEASRGIVGASTGGLLYLLKGCGGRIGGSSSGTSKEGSSETSIDTSGDGVCELPLRLSERSSAGATESMFISMPAGGGEGDEGASDMGETAGGTDEEPLPMSETGLARWLFRRGEGGTNSLSASCAILPAP